MASSSLMFVFLAICLVQQAAAYQWACTLTYPAAISSGTFTQLQTLCAQGGNEVSPTMAGSTVYMCSSNSGCSDSITATCNSVGTLTSASSSTYTCGSSSSSKCFAADMEVTVRDGSAKKMRDVQAADEVAVGSSAFSKVFMFSHRMANVTALFVELTTADTTRAPLLITADHYLYVNGKLATAQTVRVGDKLTAADGSDVAVTKVDSKTAQGLYNPHTMHGDVVVNGIRTSCYTAAINPSLAHAALWPVRMLFSMGVDLLNGAFDQGSDLLASVMPSGRQQY